MSILQELWRGNIAPQEHPISNNENCKYLTKKIIEAQNILFDGLSEEKRRQFENYDMLLMERQAILEEEGFIEAMRLGAQLVIGLIGGEV